MILSSRADSGPGPLCREVWRATRSPRGPVAPWAASCLLPGARVLLRPCLSGLLGLGGILSWGRPLPHTRPFQLISKERVARTLEFEQHRSLRIISVIASWGFGSMIICSSGSGSISQKYQFCFRHRPSPEWPVGRISGGGTRGRQHGVGVSEAPHTVPAAPFCLGRLLACLQFRPFVSM